MNLWKIENAQIFAIINLNDSTVLVKLYKVFKLHNFTKFTDIQCTDDKNDTKWIILQNEIDALIWSMIITKFHIPSFLNTCKSDNIKEVTNNPKLYYIYSYLYKIHLYIWQILVVWIRSTAHFGVELLNSLYT